ncbi:probable calcium-binding protein CML48 [Chenopodium quinoa]|uniref:EF-hand domain-containing protein n=1 Tax=Chenopodium quinoa TaxID=63459 RepID=A0A803LD14_CHEQI|nr:probable calcium-binding protein CML48 [Chenopodium quinoa]
MSSFNPSAPPMPNSSSSSYNPSNYNSNPSNYNPNYNYPEPAQSYHVNHQSYPTSNPTSTLLPYGGGGGGAPGYGSSYSPFPLGTDPEIIRSFQMVDRDSSGFIDDSELQNALSSSYHRFRLSTIRLLIFLFKNPTELSMKIRPGEFAALWSCLGQWRAIFERFDRDRSGKIDLEELRDALYSLGYAVPPSVLQLLISRYNNGGGQRVRLDFDSFVECGMVVKGLTEKFKEKDSNYTGSATITYDDFMMMVLPYLVTYN